jgi:hypothetical protein
MSKDSTKTTKLKRDVQPEAVRDAKDAAGRLADYLAGQGLKLSRAQALEALSCAAGSKDWNTFRASLSKRAINSEVDLELACRRVLHLRPGGETECLVQLYKLMHPNAPPNGPDMWHARAMTMINIVTRLYFRTQRLVVDPYSTRALRECFHPAGDRGFMSCLKLCETNFPADAVTLQAREFLSIFPAAPGTDWAHGDPFHDKFLDHWGFVASMVSKQLGDFVDAMLNDEQQVGVTKPSSAAI